MKQEKEMCLIQCLLVFELDFLKANRVRLCQAGNFLLQIRYAIWKLVHFILFSSVYVLVGHAIA
jgi:hypothetical protein